MKKLVLILMITTLAITLTACGGGKADKTSSDKAIGSSTSTPQGDAKGESVSQPETVVVPNVIENTFEVAKQTLENCGLNVKTTYKVAQVKNSNGIDVDWYEDNIVTDQSHKQGTVVVKDTEVEIIVNQLNDFKYIINSDNTVTLTEVGGTFHHPNNQAVVPETYMGYAVAAIESSMLNTWNEDAWDNLITWNIPSNTIINGSTQTKIVQY